MINGLYLCGTVHLDLAGPERLKKVLELFTPKCIAIESYPKLSQLVLEKRKELAKTSRQTLMNDIGKKAGPKITGIRYDTVKAIMGCAGFEIWVPLEYAERTGAEVVQIEDETRAERIRKSFLERMIDPSGLDPRAYGMLTIPPQTLQRLFNSCYRDTSDGKDEDEVGPRNRIFAEKIKKLDGRVLVVTGAGHLQEKPTLQGLLRQYHPKHFTLNLADYFEK